MDGIGRLVHRANRRFVEDAVLISKGKFALMAAFHKHKEQRGQFGGGYGQRTLFEALNQRRLNLRGDFRETVGSNALIGIFDVRIGKALQHHIAVFGQINQIVAEAGNHVFGYIIVRQFVGGFQIGAVVNIQFAQQRTRPSNCCVRHVEDADFGFFVRHHRFHQFHAHFFQCGADIVFEIVFNHPLDKGFAHHRGFVGNAGSRFDARRQVFGRARYDAVNHGVRRGNVGFHPFDDVVLTG